MADQSAPNPPTGGLPAATLPRTIAVAWGMYEAPQRGPKRELSHERIVEAAITLADSDGLGAVTMAKVAEALGFTTMSLYRYVTGKDELLALMQDEAGRLDGATEDRDWRQGLRDLATLMLRNYRSHPWLTEVRVSRLSLMMPNSLAVSDAALRAMRTLPLPFEEKQAVLLALVLLTRGYASVEQDLRTEAHPLDNPEVADLIASVVTRDRFPDLAVQMADRRYPDDGGEEGDDATWAIDTLLSGVEAHLNGAADTDGPIAATELTPEEAHRVAERELEATVALRKQAQLRVKELEKRVAEATRTRDRARELAKVATRR